MELFRRSTYESFRKGPPTRAPVATFGFGSAESSHWKPLQPVWTSAGIDAPL
ncbi:endoglucanase 24-like isoform X1 [Iris pallida]|uniref:Endoglucanase 24-like isoform X1 n=1 Tax=Iris pallida TaxID=29817 RepID=A0AAX6GR38_IRIPA|nr:endoglucanase 24-like isoform X1 [Iris pallida]